MGVRNLQSAAVASYPNAVQVLITPEIIIHYCQTPSLLRMKQMLTSLKDINHLLKPEIWKSVFALKQQCVQGIQVVRKKICQQFRPNYFLNAVKEQFSLVCGRSGQKQFKCKYVFQDLEPKPSIWFPRRNLTLKTVKLDQGANICCSQEFASQNCIVQCFFR